MCVIYTNVPKERSSPAPLGATLRITSKTSQILAGEMPLLVTQKEVYTFEIVLKQGDPAPAGLERLNRPNTLEHLVTNSLQQLDLWAENTRQVLTHPSSISGSSLRCLGWIVIPVRDAKIFQ